MNNVKCLNPWDPQSKRQYQIYGVYATLHARQNGGGQTDGICYAIEGNVVDRVSAKNGKGWCEDVSPTLNTQDRHAVCYTVDCRNLELNEDKSGTLQSKNVGGYSLNFTNPVLYPAYYAVENHPCDSRVRLTNDGIVQTLNARMGTGGGNVPLILEVNE